MKRLNIGAGATYIPGWTNVDIAPYAEISLDLGRDKLPFDDDSVDVVFSYHTLEHVGDYLFAVGEIHRVLKHNGLFLVGLPYVSLTYYHQVNPYHLHNFNEASFDFFDPDKLRGSAVEQATETAAILFKRGWVRYHYIAGFHFVPPPLRGWSRRHLLNTVRKLDFGLVAIKDESRPLTVNRQLMRSAFDQAMRSRVPYETQTAANRSLAQQLRGRALAWWRGQ